MRYVKLNLASTKVWWKHIIVFLILDPYFQVLISAPCVLVTPKRKLAGRLAVMKTALHFFGEYLVEGTGGSSAFKDFQQPSNSDLSKFDQKQRFSKWPPHNYLESDKGSSFNGLELLSENVHQRHLKNLKRHRRWSIGKVRWL